MITFFVFLLFIVVFCRFIFRLNTDFPIFELSLLLYLLQYLIAAIFGYHFNRYMAVPQEAYVNFIFLALLAFGAGLFSLKSKLNFNKHNLDINMVSKLGRVLFIIGVSSNFLSLFLPDQFRSILGFFIMFQWIGVFLLVFSDYRTDKLLILLFSVFILIQAILESTFIDLIVYTLFFFMFFSLKYKPSLIKKLLFLSVGFVFFVVYQGIKNEYRSIIWKDEVSVSKKIEVLQSLLNKETLVGAFNTDIQNNESLIFTMNRLNQGWQTSKVFRHVPNQVDFEYGLDFLNDVLSCFLPRLLWENKRVVNDQDRFSYYTGYKFEEKISVNIGVIGDFYLNFGKKGTIIMMFLFGHFAARLKRFLIVNFVNTNPLNLIWLPFVFSFFIRPGNEFYMVMNHIFKSFFVLLFVIIIIYPAIGIYNNSTSTVIKKK